MQRPRGSAEGPTLPAHSWFLRFAFAGPANAGSAHNNDAATSSNSRQDATQRSPDYLCTDGLAEQGDPHHTKHFSSPLSAICENLTTWGFDADSEDNGYVVYLNLVVFKSKQYRGLKAEMCRLLFVWTKTWGQQAHPFDREIS